MQAPSDAQVRVSVPFALSRLPALRMRLQYLAYARPSHGYRCLAVMQLREG